MAVLNPVRYLKNHITEELEMKNRTVKVMLMFVAFCAAIFVGTIQPTAAAEIQRINVGCSSTHATVTLTAQARFLRINVSLASNLTTTIASKVVRVYGGIGSSHSITVRYPAQPLGTRLIVAVGEWDGSKYVVPAALTGADCER